MPAASESNQRSQFAAGMRALERSKPSVIAAAAAAFVMVVVLLTGMTEGAERWLSDAWFTAGKIAPSGRTVLVTFDHHAPRYATTTNQVPHGDLAQLLLKLDAAGVSRFLIEFGLSDQPNEADDRLLERVLTELGPKVSLPSIAVLSNNLTTWHRTVPFDRFGHHATRTASDLALDSDGKIRNFGINESGLRYLISAPAWLSGAKDTDNDTSAPSNFRIDFGIDLKKIPQLDAVSMLQGNLTGMSLLGVNVIIAGFVPPTGGQYRVPRYGELTLPRITALAAETLALGRQIRSLPRSVCFVGLILLAAVMAFWCAHLGALTGSGLCAGVVLNALGFGLGLQTLVGQTVPAAGAVAASLIGYGVAQVAVHSAFRRVRHALMTGLANIDIHLANALENTSDGLLTFDRDGKLLSINTAARELFGIEGQGDLGQYSLTSMLGLQARALMVAARDRQQRRVRTTIRKNGIERHLELAVGAVPGDGPAIGAATVRDTTEQHAQFEAMRLIATRDPLTGLANRRAFEQAFRSIRPDEAPLALFICDLDGFKPVNDTLGHQAGDALLQEIAKRMVAQAGSHAVVARLGGDEFGIVIPHSTEAYAAEMAERVLSAIGRPLEINGNGVRVGASIGIALSAHHRDFQVLMERADAAMYDAKRSRCGYGFWRAGAVTRGAQPISEAV
jgi:diguanylate cyclase (GGDEF)-like protein/PAS domain S-box-containing protein